MKGRLARTILVAATALGVLAPAAGAAVNFAPKQDFPTADAFSLARGDFNGDSRDDVATASFAATDISVLLGNGDGTLQAAQNTGGPAQQTDVAAGDFNGDGRGDLVVTTIATDEAVVFLSNGDGTFGAGSPLTVGGSPQDVIVANLNADARPDIAVATQTGDTIDIFLNNGSGGFTAAPARSTTRLPGSPDGVAAADFDADGDNDLAIGTTGGGEIAFARNQGPGDVRRSGRAGHRRPEGGDRRRQQRRPAGHRGQPDADGQRRDHPAQPGQQRLRSGHDVRPGAQPRRTTSPSSLPPTSTGTACSTWPSRTSTGRRRPRSPWRSGAATASSTWARNETVGTQPAQRRRGRFQP